MKIQALTIVAAAVLAGCGSSEEPRPQPVRPVKLFTVEGTETSQLRRFPGSIEASQRADLAFRVSGNLQELLVKEGDLVQQGDLLARLDPTDYQLTVDDRQAGFDNAERNFKRAQELIVDGNISKLDYDRMEANFRTAQAALSQASQDLDYTNLRAPFDGRIARRDVDNFEEVLAKQTIFRLQNVDSLDVRIDLPEALIRTFNSTGQRAESQVGEVPATVRAWAYFEGRSDDSFPLRVKEAATKADPETQTFRVTFSMDAPTDFMVLPGMTANVGVDLSGITSRQAAKWVPVRAVQADDSLDARVWVLDPESMTVSSQPVEIGEISGESIEVRKGLVGGEEIVAVGAPYLAEGMKVSRMRLSEQAVPRADDPA
jgi:RND family efflux transporter MFP subunit